MGLDDDTALVYTRLKLPVACAVNRTVSELSRANYGKTFEVRAHLTGVARHHAQSRPAIRSCECLILLLSPVYLHCFSLQEAANAISLTYF